MNDELLKRLDLLASKLGVGAGELWRILLKEAKVEGLIDGAIAFACVLTVGAALRWISRYRGDAWDDFELIPIGIIAFALVLGLGYGYHSVCELANPEFYAFNQVLSAIK